jgi:hypothetical protein
MKILEVRPEQVICLEKNGNVSTRPNSPYYSLRYFKYNNKRIGYTFSDKSYVMESFDERIFNCWHEGRRLQLRQDLSEQLAAAINHHDMYGNVREYAELFNHAFQEEPSWEMLDMYLRNITGVQKVKDGFIIYESFKIDYKGNAWVRPQRDDEKFKRDNPWVSLCIVMKGTRHAEKMAEGGFLPDTTSTMVEVNALTMTIISKIVFLLNPNLKDKSFTGQLSKNLLFKLMQISGGE